MPMALSIQDIAGILDIYEESAEEMLNGKTEIFAEELYALAVHKEVSVGEIIDMIKLYTFSPVHDSVQMASL